MDAEVGFIETDPRVEEFMLEEEDESYWASYEDEEYFPEEDKGSSERGLGGGWRA